MKRRPVIMRLLLAGFVFWLAQYCTVYAQQASVATSGKEATNKTIVSRVFARTLPNGYQLAQAGVLDKQEGNGFFLVLSSTNNDTKAIIVQLDKLSWLKTKKIESASAAKVGKQLITQFSPELMPIVIQEDKQEKSASQYASHLRMTNDRGISEPAIALRLIYPENKTYIIVLWQQQNTQSFPLAYQQLESQAKGVIRELKEPETTENQLNERYILWRLRHIFKYGVFTHLVEPNE